MRKALIYVETIAGVGHMPVAASLARSLEENGVEVYIMASEHSYEQGQLFNFGGAEWRLLPTFLKDPETGKAQYTDNGIPYMEDFEFQCRRSAAIESYIRDVEPEFLITETWPLGKGHFDSEMLPALSACEDILKNTRLFCIGRDVMNYPNHRGAGHDSDKIGINILNRYYNGLIITGDERLFTVAESLSHAETIRVPVHYAGYFVSASPDASLDIREENREVLVTTGGGYVPGAYDKIIHDVIMARPLTCLAERDWRIVISDAYPVALREEFALRAAEIYPQGKMIIEPLRPDFRELMIDAAALITTAGLNASMEAMQAGLKRNLPIVFTPIGTMPPNATGQVPRTLKLEQMGIASAYYPENFGNPAYLASLFNEQVVKTSQHICSDLKTEGATEAARIIVGKGAHANFFLPTYDVISSPSIIHSMN